MTKKERSSTKMSKSDSFNEIQSGREHLELLSNSKALKSYERSESQKKSSSIDNFLVKLYLSF
ncbi:MAG: hypothetical protein WCJ94_04705 [bacterium]